MATIANAITSLIVCNAIASPTTIGIKATSNVSIIFICSDLSYALKFYSIQEAQEAFPETELEIIKEIYIQSGKNKQLMFALLM